jgi:hypothetical protein
MRETKNDYKILVGKPKLRRVFEKPRFGKEDNKMSIG